MDNDMSQIKEQRLFVASCIALVLTAMTFAIRARLETVFGPAGVGLVHHGWVGGAFGLDNITDHGENA